jgi:ABC-2 type transport system permease protein
MAEKSSNKIFVIAKKEFRDVFSSKIIWALSVMFLLFMIVGITNGVDEFKEADLSYQASIESVQNEEGIYQDFEEPKIGKIFKHTVEYFAMFGAMLALVLGFNSISEERKNGTLKLLLSYPVYRDNVINGKFIARILALMVLIITTLLVAFAWITFSGISFAFADIGIVLIFLGFALVYLTGFLGIGILVTLAFDDANNALLSIIIIIFLSTSLISGLATVIGKAAVEMPEDVYYARGAKIKLDASQWDTVKEQFIKRVTLTNTIKSISPTYNFQKLGTQMLDPSEVGKLMNRLQRQTSSNYGNVLKNNLFSIMYLFVISIGSFIASYIVFLRKDVR